MKVIFDTDPGIDDAMALLYLHACNNLDLVGITTILGNASIENCTENALYLAEQFNIPARLFQGADRGINNELPADYPDFVHGANGLGDVPVDISARKVDPMPAFKALTTLVSDAPGEITIIAVGRMTNLALAISADEQFAQQVKEIIFMGGAYQCAGNVTPFAEANIIGDPEATDIVFNSGIPLTMVGLDVTMQTRMSATYLTRIARASACLEPLILAINQVYSQYYLDSQNWQDFPVHDSSAVAFAARPEIFTTVSGTLGCDLEGETRGRTNFLPGHGCHRVCTGVDSQGLLEHYLLTITENNHLWN